MIQRLKQLFCRQDYSVHASVTKEKYPPVQRYQISLCTKCGKGRRNFDPATDYDEIRGYKR